MATFTEPIHFANYVTFSSNVLTLPAACVSDANVAAAAALAASKSVHRHVIEYKQDDGTAVAAAIVPVHIARVAGTAVAIEVVCIDAPSGGDLTFTVDLLVCDAGTPAPASILDAVITYPNATPDCTVRVGTIDTTAYADGDTLVIQVAVSGSTGVQGQGLIVTVTVDEGAT